MLRDVFYYGKKPNVHPREKFAKNLADARQQCTTEHFWIINEFCNYRGFDWDFDFEFLPDEDVWAAEHNNVWPSQHQKDSGTWLCPEKHSDIIIYRADVNPVTRVPIMNNWFIEQNVDTTKFDFSWHPDSSDPPFIYRWGNKFYPVEIGHAIEYRTENAKSIKYMTDVVELLPNWECWEINDDVDQATFDFSWVPEPSCPPYIYVWGNQWVDPRDKAAIKFVVPGATEIKYMDQRVKKLPNMKNWIVPKNINISNFDFSWEPSPHEPPFIYQFSTQWQKSGGPRYVIPDATSIKYIENVNVAISIANKDNWEIPNDILVDLFDFSWHPSPDDPLYIYQFGTQWQKTGGPRYIPPGANKKDTPIKYMGAESQCAVRIPSTKNWVVPKGVDVSNFDFSWHPDDTSPNYIYQFGVLSDPDCGPRYNPDANNGEVVHLEYVKVANDVNDFPRYYVETTLDALVVKHPTEIFWALNPELDYTKFDFSWRPNIEQAKYVHAFGSSDSKLTQTYLINASMWLKGIKDINWVVDTKLDDESLHKLFVKPDMFFIDRGNEESQLRYSQLKEKFPGLQKTRYLSSWVDTINRCINRAKTTMCWILNSELDYTDFDFEYHPNPWQMKMVHVFGTQWSHWGTTFMVNRETFPNDTKYVKTIEHLSNVNIVKNRIAKAVNVLHDIVYIDHGNLSETEIQSIELSGHAIVKYNNSYIDTFKTLLSMVPVRKEHYIWVVSTVCDYTNFDFTYICDPFTSHQLHVFPSDRQKFGDTFLVNVNKLRELIEGVSRLEDCKINFNQHQRAFRKAAPVIITDGDSHCSSVNTEFNFPYAIFKTNDNTHVDLPDIEPISLWSAETKSIVIVSTGGSCVVMPKEVKKHVKNELYDYPYIITSSKVTQSSPLDIVFLSNGETNADENFDYLHMVSRKFKNRLVRINGVNGRVESQRAAANASNTSWYFLVNAKLKINEKFDFTWQPDRLQVPKHYIFLASNLVNGLEYGHMAIVANNKQLTLCTNPIGLDFTMDSENEVLTINCGTGVYNVSEWDTWRTAFREVIKLRKEDSEISNKRMSAWLTKGDGAFGEFSIKGANDAIEYYDSVSGDVDKLKLSYEWDWLRKYYDRK